MEHRNRTRTFAPFEPDIPSLDPLWDVGLSATEAPPLDGHDRDEVRPWAVDYEEVE